MGSGTLFSLGIIFYIFVAIVLGSFKTPYRNSPGKKRASIKFSELSGFLLGLYLLLGFCAIIVDLGGVFRPIYEPNYLGILYLTALILVGIHSFRRFSAAQLANLVSKPAPGQRTLENFLIVTQLGAILFFAPFAIAALTGDTRMNRLYVNEAMDALGAGGIVNILAGMIANLFHMTIVFAFLRSCQPNAHSNRFRILALLIASTCFPIYTLAYVGRDGMVLWVLTVAAVYWVFRRWLPPFSKSTLALLGGAAVVVGLIPLYRITYDRFADEQGGIGWAILGYFGRQIQTFSDYSSIERPLTYGSVAFPKFFDTYCDLIQGGDECLRWETIRNDVFQQYLVKGLEPWLFATYVSEFVSDFGYVGAAIVLLLFGLFTRHICSNAARKKVMSLSALLLILYFFLVPLWGVFYFRIATINSAIVSNALFMLWAWALGRFLQKRAGGSNLTFGARA